LCEPVSISLAIAAVAASTAQQQQASKVQNKYEKIAYGQRKEAAIEDFAQLRERTFQERAKAAQEIQRVTAQARSAAASARLNAIESGTGGHSVNTLLADFERGELANVGVVQSNLADTEHRIQAEAVARGRIPGPQKVLGPLDTPLGILSAGLGAASAGYSAHQSYQASLPPTEE